eukprot:gene6056-12213_t
MQMENDWKVTSSKGIPDPPMAVAEPRHRIAPKGISSGISIRLHPDASIEQVRKTCYHYLDKCRGKYADSKLAARYVYQLAHDVLVQMDHWKDETDVYLLNMKLIENLVQEWNYFFPTSLQEFNSPKLIAMKLEQQQAEITQLRAALAVEQKARINDTEFIKRNMEGQLQACSFAAVTEKESLSKKQHAQLSKFHKEIEGCEREWHKKLNECIQSYEYKVTTIKSNYEAEILKRQNFEDEKFLVLHSEYTKLQNHLKDTEESYNKQIKILANKLAEKNKHPIIIEVNKKNNNDIDDDDIVTVMLNIQIDSNDLESSLSQDRDQYRSRTRPVHVRHRDANFLLALTKRYNELLDDSHKLRKSKKTQENNVEKLIIDRDRHLRRGNSMDEVNEALREAIVMRTALPCTNDMHRNLNFSSKLFERTGYCDIDDSRENSTGNVDRTPLVHFYRVDRFVRHEHHCMRLIVATRGSPTLIEMGQNLTAIIRVVFKSDRCVIRGPEEFEEEHGLVQGISTVNIGQPVVAAGAVNGKVVENSEAVFIESGNAKTTASLHECYNL